MHQLLVCSFVSPSLLTSKYENVIDSAQAVQMRSVRGHIMINAMKITRNELTLFRFLFQNDLTKRNLFMFDVF